MNPGRNAKTGQPYLEPWKLAVFGDLRFRRAVAHAVDRRSISNIVYFGMAEPLYGPIPPANKKWYCEDVVRYEYDLDKSRSLLEDAGLRDRDGDGIREDGKGHPLHFTLLTNAGNKERIAVANVILDDLAKIGIKMTLAPTESNAMVTRIRETFDYDAILFGLTGGIPPDPIMSANVFKSSGRTHFWYPGAAAPRHRVGSRGGQPHERPGHHDRSNGAQGGLRSGAAHRHRELSGDVHGEPERLPRRPQQVHRARTQHPPSVAALALARRSATIPRAPAASWPRGTGADRAT